jgi:hypothetical protein
MICFISFSVSHRPRHCTRSSIRLKDINECTEGSDDCNRKTQLCLNTRGSYKCQEKIGEKCLPGLKYNQETKLCEGAFAKLIYFFCLSPNCFPTHKSISVESNQFSPPFNQISTSVNWIRTRATMATNVSTLSDRLSASELDLISQSMNKGKCFCAANGPEASKQGK